MLGAGKYDDLCTHVRKAAKAKGAIIMIINGEHGSGFSCQLDAAMTHRIPEILERMAKDIREHGPFGGV